ncbi:MAG: hypothetical protein AB7F35_31370 [Acetobacteraceae bacterium]
MRQAAEDRPMGAPAPVAQMMAHASPGTPLLLAGISPSAMVLDALGEHANGVGFAPDLTPPAPTTMLRLETVHGDPVNAPHVFAACWHRPPYALTIQLVCYGPGSSVREIVDQATIGTKGDRAAVQSAIERASMMLVADYLRGTSRGFSPPNGAEAVQGRTRTNGGRLRYAMARCNQKLRVEVWGIGSTNLPLADVVQTGSLGDITWHANPDRDAYLADPYPWPGTGLLLCEEMALVGGRGTIIACEETEDGLRPVRTILATDRHHSYPCTFVDQGITYLLPEATDRGATMLYRLAPDGTLSAFLPIGAGMRLADPTLFRHDGRYWIAATDLDIGWHDNLCLFHAETLAGPWQSHRLRPAKLDVRGARPAGPPFVVDGTLYRPGQDCAETYGAGITLWRVDVLTPDEFRETLVHTLRPDPNGPYPHGLHTLVSDGERIWVDGKRFVLDVPSLRQKLLTRMARTRIPRGIR